MHCSAVERGRAFRRFRLFRILKDYLIHVLWVDETVCTIVSVTGASKGVVAVLNEPTAMALPVSREPTGVCRLIVSCHAPPSSLLIHSNQPNTARRVLRIWIIVGLMYFTCEMGTFIVSYWCHRSIACVSGGSVHLRRSSWVHVTPPEFHE